MSSWLLTGQEPVTACPQCGAVEQVTTGSCAFCTTQYDPAWSYRALVETERAEMCRALESGEIRHYPVCPVCGGNQDAEALYAPCADDLPGQHGLARQPQIAVVVSTHRATTMIGYKLCPVVVALNPAFRVGGGEPHAKYTVCQYSTGHCDLVAAKNDLAALEPGWGGSPMIIGSPQGVASQLTTEQVVEVVTRHLK
ncbi:MAG: hypothetical protein WAP74_04005 [Patescibacteria group bacterium]